MFRNKVRSALAFAAAATLAAAAITRAADAAPADAFLGINHGDATTEDFIEDLKATGLHMVRDGFNCKPDAKTDAKIAAYVAAGIDVHVSLNVRGEGINVPDYQAWLANYKQRCVEIMTAYKGKVSYYIVGNEPDKKDASTGRLKPEQEVDFCRMAYQASREVDPTGGIKIESGPMSSPDGARKYLKAMFDVGLTECCDYVGIHAYSSQINDGRFDQPWKLMQASGHAMKPLAVSELGVSTDWKPKNATDEETLQWKADFVSQAYVQAKRYGYANAILFESSSQSKWPITFAQLRDADRAEMKTTYENIQNNFKPHGLLDGDFESANDPKHQWVVIDDPSDGVWDMTPFNFQADGGHAGKCLQIEAAAKTSRGVRQVVSNLKIGQPVTINCWAFGTGAALRAEGFNALNGREEKLAQTSAAGDWEQLSVTFTPTNPWVVIELSAAAGDGAVKFDDVSLNVEGGQ